MSEDDYGLYVIFQSWTEIAAIIITLNLGSYVFNNAMMKYETDRDGFAAAMLGLTGVVGILWMLIFLAAPYFWSDLLGLEEPFVFLLILRCLIMPCYSYWSARLRYEFNYKPVVILTIVFTVLTPAVSIPVIYCAEDKITAALISQICVMSIVYLVPFISIIRKSKKFLSFQYWKFALKFNLPLLPHLLSTVVLQQSDRIMISNICGMTFAAVYSVAYSAGMAMSFIHGSIVQALTPWMYQTMQDKKYGRIQPVGIILVSIVGVACFVLALFAPEIFILFAPPAYQEGIYAVPPVAASVVLMTAFNLFVTVEYYYEETIWVMIASIIAGATNVALNFLLLPIFGYLVAGYTTLFCYFLLVVGHFVLMKKALLKHNPAVKVFDGKIIFPYVFVIVGMITLTSLLYPLTLFRYLLLVLLAIALLVFTIYNRKDIKQKLKVIY